MRAALLTRLPSESFEMAMVDQPEPGPEWIEVRVEACGICGTDLHILDGLSYRLALPFVMGHEPVGTVTKGPSDLMGTRVVPSIFLGCGRCEQCRAGDERLCISGPNITGIRGIWGGFAEKMWVHPRQVIVVPQGLSPSSAAALVDAGASAYNASRLALGQNPHGVLVLGGGPVGFLTASILRSKGVTVTVIEPNVLRRTALKSQGFDAASVLDETDPREFDMAIDCSGVAEAFRDVITWLPPKGWCFVVGYAEVPLMDMATVSRKELTLRGVRSGRRDDLAAVLALAESQVIDLPPMDTWSLENINVALSELKAGRVAGKAVITVA